MRGLATGSFVIAAVLSLFSTPAFSQTALAGIVRDSSGAILPGVSVEATSNVLPTPRTTVTGVPVRIFTYSKTDRIRSAQLLGATLRWKQANFAAGASLKKTSGRICLPSRKERMSPACSNAATPVACTRSSAREPITT